MGPLVLQHPNFDRMGHQMLALFWLLCAAAADTHSDYQPDSALRGAVSDVQAMPRGPQGQGVTPSAGSPNVQVSSRTRPVAAPVQAANILGASELVLIAIAAMVLCCILANCVAKKERGCLFGGVKDICEGDGQIGSTAHAEEAAMAGLLGDELANKGSF